jgi:hypothetical protein
MMYLAVPTVSGFLTVLQKRAYETPLGHWVAYFLRCKNDAIKTP